MEDMAKVNTILHLLLETDKINAEAWKQPGSTFKSVFTEDDTTKAKKMLWELLEKPLPQSHGRI